MKNGNNKHNVYRGGKNLLPEQSFQPLVPRCNTEYEPLRDVFLCEPKHMTIVDVINETQKHFKDENINVEKAMAQHKQFVDTLRKYNVNVHLLTPGEDRPEQVFARDIGFTIGDKVFIAGMSNDIRFDEQKVLKQELKNLGIDYIDLKGTNIEGGDVVVDGDHVFVGISDRTTEEAVEVLRGHLEGYEVVPIPFHPKYLHLDCVFNILSPKEALVFRGAMEEKYETVLAKHYDLIHVEEDEQFTLGVNVLSIGNKKVISLPINKNTNKELKKRGYEIVEVDITEIIKSGGSFRCCSMPIVRK